MKKAWLLIVFSLVATACTTRTVFNTADLRTPFLQNRPQIETCFEKQKSRLPAKEATVTLKLHINDEGQVDKTFFRKKQSTVNKPSLNRCLSRVVKRMKFPKQASMELVYPFYFQPSAKIDKTRLSRSPKTKSTAF